MFFTRLLSSIVLVLVALVTLLRGGYLLAAVLLLISLVAYRELCKACNLNMDAEEKSVNALEAAGYAGIVVYYGIVVFSSSQAAQMLSILFVMIGMMFVYVFTFPKYQASQVMAAFFGFAYAPVMFSFIYQTRQLQYGIYLVWMIFISSWVCDTFAYLTGMMIGKHKMTPKLSPKKSVEGAVGGVVGAALLFMLYTRLVINVYTDAALPLALAAVLGGVGALVSMVGDLAASAVKRDHDIKDYGKLIPGHGGIMDRFDSVIVTAPIIFIGIAMLLQ